MDGLFSGAAASLEARTRAYEERAGGPHYGEDCSRILGGIGASILCVERKGEGKEEK